MTYNPISRPIGRLFPHPARLRKSARAVWTSGRWAPPLRNRKFADSPLEGACPVVREYIRPNGWDGLFQQRAANRAKSLRNAASYWARVSSSIIGFSLLTISRAFSCSMTFRSASPNELSAASGSSPPSVSCSAVALGRLIDELLDDRPPFSVTTTGSLSVSISSVFRSLAPRRDCAGRPRPSPAHLLLAIYLLFAASPQAHKPPPPLGLLRQPWDAWQIRNVDRKC